MLQITIQMATDFEYLHASNTNVSNFVSIRLSGDNNYQLWKTQMLCLMGTHDMCGLVDDAEFDDLRASSPKIKKQYDNLLKGWIFGSISEGVLATVVGLAKDGSAKDVWDELRKAFGDSTMCSQQDSAQTKPEAEAEAEVETKDNNISTVTEMEKKDAAVSAKTETPGEHVISIDRKKDVINERNKALFKAIKEKSWPDIKCTLEKHEGAIKDEINSNKDTIIHLAVARFASYNFIKSLLDFIKDDEVKEVLEKQNVDGSTALHVAAIVGNTYAAKFLVEKHNELLRILDNEGKDPMYIASSNMHYYTFMYLYDEAAKESTSQDPRHIKKGVQVLLVNAISEKDYGSASKLIETFPEFAVENDEALMAIARNFPSEPKKRQSLGDFLNKRATTLISSTIFFLLGTFGILLDCQDMLSVLIRILWLPLTMIHFMVYFSIQFLTYTGEFLFRLVYFLWLKTRIEDVDLEEKILFEAAKTVLEMVCNEIDKSKVSNHSHNPRYDKPLLEAARQNTYHLVHEILVRSPEAIHITDKNGYDIFQLALMHRSDKVFNLIYENPKSKNRFRMFKDSFGNNMLHLTGSLAHPDKLNRELDAALQLQQELQWFQATTRASMVSVKRLVIPAYRTEENIYKETPNMVFMREHKQLKTKGEEWMKTTAESCCISAALITTIVFAAAITVPGGSNQELGIPIFRNNTAFTIFAISDAISLFTSCTSLLLFSSILTARFAEQDFLILLPRRMIFGMYTLFFSTTAMMVAFSATLFLVFCHQNPWMLAPICGLACIPIVCFFNVQFPFLVELYPMTFKPRSAEEY
ncbi:hypothetical protein OSB04_un000065 [Centaurea solstitialis]|uniref:PGG domain-containing protein n=1 Tax=Centaurea solstitialis TaxID=347529 RepID=A0AA38SIT6_9ASTR|nr:hypothetical protein OSB04_un000065 [Centaurea solstitialis]